MKAGFHGLGLLGPVAIAAALLCSAPASAQGSAYPHKPIRVMVGFAPGGTTDIIARVLGRRMEEILGQPVVIEDRPGADGMIATRAVAKSAPDGYTLLLAPNGHAINVSIYKDVGFDPIKDFAPIILVGDAPNFVVVPNTLPVHSVAELIAMAKSRPGKLNYASSAPAGHLATEMFNSMAGIKMVRIPFKGAGDAVPAIVSGDVDVFITGVVNMLPMVKANKVRAIAVTGKERYARMPELPTVAEAGVPGYSASTWYGLLAPAGTPPDIVNALNRAVRTAMDDPNVKKQLDDQGLKATPGTPAEFTRFIKEEIEQWARVVKQTGARID